MTWQEFALARQVLAEERVGKAVRETVNAEDEAWVRNARALQMMKG